ncbi:MAG: YlmC/YmxH family sporulation protein, partial [Bacillota bacterium]|nr:YlmC/YmxH family sporulation protein [Bacillota bacterium]
MEDKIYSLEDIKRLQVVEINTGKIIGFIKDFRIDLNSYKIKSMIIPLKNYSIFNKINSIEIKWDNIKKIGEDVILVQENL